MKFPENLLWVTLVSFLVFLMLVVGDEETRSDAIYEVITACTTSKTFTYKTKTYSCTFEMAQPPAKVTK